MEEGREGERRGGGGWERRGRGGIKSVVLTGAEDFSASGYTPALKKEAFQLSTSSSDCVISCSWSWSL